MIEFIFPIEFLPDGPAMAGAAIVSVLRNHGVPVVGFSEIEGVLSGSLVELEAEPGQIRFAYLTDEEIETLKEATDDRNADTH